MSDIMAINPMGMSPDAWNWFNYAYQYQPQFKGTSETGASQTDAQVQAASQSNEASENVPMVQQADKKEKKKGGKGLIAAGVAAGALCLFARKKGGGSITKGFKLLWNAVSGKEAPMELTQNNGKWIAKIGKPNVINERQGDITEQAQKLGLSVDAPENGFKNADAKIARYKATINEYDVEIINGKNGTKIHSCFKEGKDIVGKLSEDGNKEVKEQIDDFIKKVNDKNSDALSKLDKVTYCHKDKDGTVCWFIDATQNNNGKIASVITDKFYASEPNNTLSRYLLDNPKVDERMKNIINDNKVPKGSKITSYEYEIKNIGNLKIENGEITGITQNGKFIPSCGNEFAGIKYGHQEEFEKALNAKPEECLNKFYEV